MRLPYFLGLLPDPFPEQKTSHAIHTTGAEEMSRIRRRFHGAGEDDPEMIERHARSTEPAASSPRAPLASGIRW